MDLKRDNVAIVRIEQLYPFPKEPLKAALAPCADGTPVFWVQEEPENMGVWRFLRGNFGDRLFDRLPFSGIYRQKPPAPPPAAPAATGWSKRSCCLRRSGKGDTRVRFVVWLSWLFENPRRGQPRYVAELPPLIPRLAELQKRFALLSPLLHR